MRVSLNGVLVFAVVAMVQLLSPARAAEPPQTALEAERPAAPQADQAAAQQQQDSALNIIIIQSEDERFIPNPYKNPRPRLISDGWAQRT